MNTYLVEEEYEYSYEDENEQIYGDVEHEGELVCALNEIERLRKRKWVQRE